MTQLNLPESGCKQSTPHQALDDLFNLIESPQKAFFYGVHVQSSTSNVIKQQAALRSSTA